jgi:hypothetical protein
VFTAKYELNLYTPSGPLIVSLGEGKCSELSGQSPSLQRQERPNTVLRVMREAVTACDRSVQRKRGCSLHPNSCFSPWDVNGHTDR